MNIIKFIKRKIKNWLNDLGYYRAEDLVVGGWCGLDGEWIPDQIFSKWWRYGICKNCIEKYGKAD